MWLNAEEGQRLYDLATSDVKSKGGTLPSGLLTGRTTSLGYWNRFARTLRKSEDGKVDDHDIGNVFKARLLQADSPMGLA